jgi:hypothetical protein
LAEVLTYSARLRSVGRIRRQIVKVDLDISGDKQIQTPIPIVITPRRAGAPGFARHTQFFSDVGKGSVTVIVI